MFSSSNAIHFYAFKSNIDSEKCGNRGNKLVELITTVDLGLIAKRMRPNNQSRSQWSYNVAVKSKQFNFENFQTEMKWNA